MTDTWSDKNVDNLSIQYQVRMSIRSGEISKHLKTPLNDICILEFDFLFLNCRKSGLKKKANTPMLFFI